MSVEAAAGAAPTDHLAGAPGGAGGMGSSEVMEFWLTRFLLNLLGYASIFVPGYLVIRWVRQSKYLEKAHHGCVPWLLRLCVDGSRPSSVSDEEAAAPEMKPPPQPPQHNAEGNRMRQVSNLALCCVGLQGAYLTWGVLQEKIMTRDYISDTGHTSRFKDSQFLVFMNRILACLLSAAYLLLTRQPRHTAPLYKYSFASLSNILSSWCQYEALKYVSFPSQVLAKACKIIPVMLMGKLMSGKSYQYYEYVTATMISVGMSLFLLSRTDASHPETVTTFSGIIILAGYMIADSFTSNWQGDLFSTYKMSSVQMMCGVNFFSCLLTFVSLVEQGSFAHSFTFVLHHFAFFWDLMLLSLCSALGQMFIFYTISLFGAVVFVIIMTVRQGFAILLSCIIYGHVVNVNGVVGIALVFIALFLRIYASNRQKAIKSGGGGGAGSGGGGNKL